MNVDVGGWVVDGGYLTSVVVVQHTNEFAMTVVLPSIKIITLEIFDSNQEHMSLILSRGVVVDGCFVMILKA